MAKKAKAKVATRSGYGILNPFGDMWTSHVFDRPEQAEEYIRKFWRDFPGSKVDPATFKVVNARQSATYVGEHQ